MTNKTTTRILLTAFGVGILLASSVTSFSFFYNYFTDLIPPSLFGAEVARLIAGAFGAYMFDFAVIAWLYAYTDAAKTSEQRSISLILIVMAFIGSSGASVGHLALSASGGKFTALEAYTANIEIASIITVIIGLVFNFAGYIYYRTNSYENQQKIAESNRQDILQEAEREQAQHLDNLIAQKVKEKLTAKADALADQQAERLAGQFSQRENAKYANRQPKDDTVRQAPEVSENGKVHRVPFG